LLKARILLKADISEAGEGWSDSRIIKALDTSACNRGKFPGPLTLACHYDEAGRISSARRGIWAPGMPRRSPKNS